MWLKQSLTLLLSFFILMTSQAQKFPFKVGKVSKEELEMVKCDFYPEAKSMILGKYGSLRFKLDDDNSFQYEMDVAVRKKIFDIEDADEGNIKIRVYDPVAGNAKEKITQIKAYSYNLIDGKIEKEKLRNDDYFETRLSDYWIEISFAIPGIVDGTVIEYTYVKESDYLNSLTTWKFQSDIPIAWSEFRTRIPEYYNYQVNQLGNIYNTDSEERNVNETFTIRYQADINTNRTSGRSSQRSSNISSLSKYRRFVMKNIPPIENEPYLNNRSDVPSRIEFQLISTKFPQRPVDYVAGDYDKFNQELLSRSNFGEKLDNGRFMKSYLQGENFSSPIEGAVSIFNHISRKIQFNGVYRFTSNEAGREAYNNEQGSVAAINLSLIAAFREGGLKAYPIILSTRGHGTLHPVYPSYDGFNYVIAAVEVDGQFFLCDASSKLPFGTIPLRCRNGNGWAVKEGGGLWIDLKNSSEYKAVTMMLTSIENDIMLTEVSEKITDYAAISDVKEIQESSMEEYIESIKNRFEDSEVRDVEISDADKITSLKTKYTMERAYSGADVIYFQPILTGSIDENPFKRETRISPIDFPYQQFYKVYSQVKIPAGYQVELPEPTFVKLPNDAGSFVFNVGQNNDVISITSEVRISRTFFTADEYPALKQFYQLIADKNRELIVFSK